MLMFGVFVAIVAMVLTRKSEIIVHDPAEGLPKGVAGGATRSGGFKDLVSTMREVAREIELQAKAEQQAAEQEPTPVTRGPVARRAAQAAGPALEEIKDLAQRGQLLDAIKLYRMRFRVDLKTAKEAVEKLRAGG